MMANILDLPNEMLFKIMQYVPPNERHSVATVCTRFAEIMTIPALNKDQEFHFEETLFTLPHNEELKSICRSQCHWKKLSLKFRRLTKRAANRFKRLNIILRREFSEMWKLERLTVTFEKPWGNDMAKDIFVQNFVSMFCYQSRLSEVNIIDLKANHFQGCYILRTLLDGCGETVRTLRLVHFFRLYNPNFSNFTEQFEVLVTSFVNLHELELNYCCISRTLLHLLALRYPGQLNNLTLWIKRPFGRHLDNVPFMNQAYTALKLACPNLIVVYKNTD